MKYDKSKIENKDKKNLVDKITMFDFPACPNYQLSVKLIILLDN